ncbi:MAG: helix-turn-helix domain-containing protein [Gemmatimonadales bacterium]|nr:helix-turn-helix domain-containing protein [Gemmatimonadales bacterium]MBA3708699.1 helix-turn-helix domain-containing protein [Planctomycetota bacterium]
MAPFVVALPHGTPGYGGHQRLVWPPGGGAVRQWFDDWAVHWVTHGEATWELKDGRRIAVAANSFLVLPPKVPAVLDQTRAALVLWSCHLVFRPESSAVPTAMAGDVIDGDEIALVPLSFSAADAPGVLRAFRELSLLAPSADAALWRLERTAITLAGELAAFARARTRVRAPGRILGAELHDDAPLAAVIRRIDADPAHPWRIGDIARSLAISTQWLHELCRSMHGTSLKGYIIRARLDLAARLLRGPEPRLTMREISERCGFSSQHFFSRQFRSFHGITPRAHRAGDALGVREEKEAGSWGEPTIVLDPRRASWESGWTTHSGGFAAIDGRVVSQQLFGDLLVCDQRIVGDVAIEFEGRLPDDVPPSDLSIFWIRTDGWRTLGRKLEASEDVYRLQVGASSAYTAIMHGPRTHLACSDFRPVPGRRHRVRAEVRGNRLSLSVDGRTLCEHVGLFPLVGGYVGIYAYFPGVSFGDVRIFLRQPSAVVPATAVADFFLDQQRYEPAAEHYALIAAAHAGTRLAQKATFKRGLSLCLLGRDDEARSAWAGLVGTTWEEPVRLHLIERLFSDGRHDDVLAEMGTLTAQGRPETRAQLAIRWASQAERLTTAALRDGQPATLTRYLDARERLFPNRATTDNAAAEALLALGRFTEVLERLPRQRNACARALLYQGREQEVLARYDDQVLIVIEALHRMGRSAEIAERFPAYHLEMDEEGRIMRGVADDLAASMRIWRASMIAQGRAAEVLALADPGEGYRRRAMIMLGRESELVGDAADDIDVLMACGSWDRAAEEFAGDFWFGMWPRHARGLEAFIAGDQEEARARFAVPPGWEFHQQRFHLMHYLVAPFLRELAGERGACAEACAFVLRERRWAYEQLPWHNASYVLGTIDDSRFLAQPHGAFARADLLLCRAMRRERSGDRAAAARDYRAYIDLPRHRRGLRYDPLPGRFAAWRASLLT